MYVPSLLSVIISDISGFITVEAPEVATQSKSRSDLAQSFLILIKRIYPPLVIFAPFDCFVWTVTVTTVNASKLVTPVPETVLSVEDTPE